MDHGTQYLSDHFLNQLKFWGITPSFAFVAEPHVAINLFIALGMCPLALWRLRREDRFLPSGLRGLFAIGAAGGLATVCQMTAISMALVPLVIAIKRSSAVMSVIWGHILFGESGLKERLSGVGLMTLGVLLVAFG